jgi:hypothetical protein
VRLAGVSRSADAANHNKNNAAMGKKGTPAFSGLTNLNAFRVLGDFMTSKNNK